MTPSLLHQALYDPSFWRATSAARALAAQPPPAAEIQGACETAFASGDEQTRRRAVRLVQQLAPAGAWRIGWLRSGLSDPSWRVRRAVVLALVSEPRRPARGELPGGTGVSPVRTGETPVPPGMFVHAARPTSFRDLLTALADEVSGVRAAAVEGLAHLGTAEVVVPLLARLRDSDEDVRERVAEVLQGLPLDTAALPTLTIALSDEVAAVRQQAATTINRLGARAASAVPALLPLLKDAHRAVRVEAILALGSIAPVDAIEPLLSCMPEGGEVGRAVAQALACLGRRSPRVEIALLDVLQEQETARWKGAARALGLLGSTAALEVLDRCCRRGSLGMRRRAVRALAWFAEREEVLSLLEQMLRDSNARLRRAAAASLGQLGSRAVSAVAGLLRLLHGRDRRTRRICRASLESIVTGLSQAESRWLALLAAPRRGPGKNLRCALEQPDLPGAIRDAFRATCVRRLIWHRRRSTEETSSDIANLSAWQVARLAARAAGNTGEHAWQIACLWKLLHDGA